MNTYDYRHGEFLPAVRHGIEPQPFDKLRGDTILNKFYNIDYGFLKHYSRYLGDKTDNQIFNS